MGFRIWNKQSQSTGYKLTRATLPTAGCCMEPGLASARVNRFGPFELSRDAAELRKNGIRLKLQDQPFQVLCTLLDHPGELVTREQLRQQLWPDGTFVDFEHGLNTAIKKLRDVLSDDAETPRYIETIPRKGYRFISQTASIQPAQQTIRRKRLTALMVALGLAVVASVGFAVYSKLSSSSLRVISAAKQLTFAGDLLMQPQTDGRRVYYARFNQNRIYSVPVNGGDATSFATNLHNPALMHISPDGSTLLVRQWIGPAGSLEDRIWLMPTNGSPPRPLGDIRARWAAWSPDGKTIAFSRGKSIYVTDDEGLTYRKLNDVPGLVTYIRWAPNGRRLRFDVTDPKTFTSSIWEAQIGREPRLLLPGTTAGVAAMYGDWTRDARHFLFRCDRGGGWECCYLDETLFQRTKKPAALTATAFDVFIVTLSPLENKVFVQSRRYSGSLFRFNPKTGTAATFLPEFNGQNTNFSPDGKWIVVSQLRKGRSTLWRVSGDGTEWMQLTDSRFEAFNGNYSPDGERIAACLKGPDGLWKIYLVPHGGGAIQTMNAPIESQIDANWIDRDSILFGQPPRYQYDPEAPRALYSYNLRTNSLTKLPGTDGWFSPRISPDRRAIAGLSIDEHELGLYDPASRKWRILINEPQHRVGGPIWSSDGKWVYATLYDQRLVTRVRLSDGLREDVAHCRAVTGAADCDAAAIAPDGSIILDSYQYDSNLYSLEYK